MKKQLASGSVPFVMTTGLHLKHLTLPVRYKAGYGQPALPTRACSVLFPASAENKTNETPLCTLRDRNVLHRKLCINDQK
ncbi:MAG: hypothetical protein CVU43_05810 [Chloroflexi bacterium HGW-Chloroflexi-5]|nr:MAG: hypothetical protein CVU43_05810 [Chloroflexi bacterium HGW-Chloroflexi-5]